MTWDWRSAGTGTIVTRSRHWLRVHGGRDRGQLGIITDFSWYDGHCWPVVRWEGSVLRRALWLLRRQDARPHESNPAAAQYDGIATVRAICREYRRRGWTVPKRSKGECPS